MKAIVHVQVTVMLCQLTIINDTPNNIPNEHHHDCTEVNKVQKFVIIIIVSFQSNFNHL